jgi:exodeoxyribonuclease-1
LCKLTLFTISLFDNYVKHNYLLPGQANTCYARGVNHLQTFFFYDLETSGLDPRRQRVMQFAGQRTDMELKPIGAPVNLLVRLTDEVLPDAMAILTTGITPQSTQQTGLTEAAFLKRLMDEVCTPGTIMTGFNSVRFDDEYMRHTLFRNFYDPYEWTWSDGRSRWDLLDVVRMTRALRPEGIEWPFDDKGNATNRLELLTTANGIVHTAAHDALSDVEALIDVSRLIKTHQPKMFDFLLGLRNKREVAKLVNLDEPKPFVYTSGRYPKEQLHTTVALPLTTGSNPGSVVVYDLRHDPELYANLSIDDLKKKRFAKWADRQAEGFLPLPAKELAPNKCPAVAPLSVLNADVEARISLTRETALANLAKLKDSGLADKLREVFRRDKAFPPAADVDASLYDGFMNEGDKRLVGEVRRRDADSLADFHPNFGDPRLPKLLLRYKARNHPASLSADEQAQWQEYRHERLAADRASFDDQVLAAAALVGPDDLAKQELLEALNAWADEVDPPA